MADVTPTHIARFWSKANVAADSECWTWNGAANRKGYGRFKIGRMTVQAHRFAWELFNGEPLGERFACHHCDNPRCVNPNHIYAGDVNTNAADAVERGRIRAGSLPGESNPQAKLTLEDVREIRRRIDRGETNVSIARDFPVTHSMISVIRRNQAWGKPGTKQGTSDAA